MSGKALFPDPKNLQAWLHANGVLGEAAAAAAPKLWNNGWFRASTAFHNVTFSQLDTCGLEPGLVNIIYEDLKSWRMQWQQREEAAEEKKKIKGKMDQKDVEADALPIALRKEISHRYSRLKLLSEEEKNAPILIEVYAWKGNGKHRALGSFKTTVDALLVSEVPERKGMDVVTREAKSSIEHSASLPERGAKMKSATVSAKATRTSLMTKASNKPSLKAVKAKSLVSKPKLTLKLRKDPKATASKKETPTFKIGETEKRILEAMAKFNQCGNTKVERDRLSGATRLKVPNLKKYIWKLKKNTMLEERMDTTVTPFVTTVALTEEGRNETRGMEIEGGSFNAKVHEEIKKSLPDGKIVEFFELIADGEVHYQERVARQLGFTKGKNQAGFVNALGSMQGILYYPTTYTVQLVEKECFPYDE